MNKIELLRNVGKELVGLNSDEPELALEYAEQLLAAALNVIQGDNHGVLEDGRDVRVVDSGHRLRLVDHAAQGDVG
jgi:hypothetical protein